MNQHAGQLFLEEASRYRPDLPYPPSLLRDLFSMTREDSLATVDDIALVVARDQGLTTKILALANSAFYGLQAKVASLGRGVSLLGIKEIRSLVLLLGVQSLTTDVAMPKGFVLTDYWAHQLSVGVMCRKVAELVGTDETTQLDPDILFTSGLLHDFGKLVTALLRPAQTETILALAAEKGLAMSAMEEEFWGIEHGLVGGMVLGAWDLPPELTEPITWHHAPTLSPEHPLEASVVALADGLTHHFNNADAPEAQSWREIAHSFGLDEDELAQTTAEVLSDESLFQFLSVLD